MNPDTQPLEPIDPPDNTGGGGRSSVDSDANPDASETRRLAIDPPDNTGGG